MTTLRGQVNAFLQAIRVHSKNEGDLEYMKAAQAPEDQIKTAELECERSAEEVYKTNRKLHPY